MANYDFDLPGQLFRRHTGLQALLAIQNLRGHALRASSGGPNRAAATQLPSTSMRAQDTHEDVFVVGQVGHRLDVINMGIL